MAMRKSLLDSSWVLSGCLSAYVLIVRIDRLLLAASAGFSNSPLAANAGYSLGHEPRRIVPSNLKSASARLIALAIGHAPLD